VTRHRAARYHRPRAGWRGREGSVLRSPP
jgi:hypothetical protein